MQCDAVEGDHETDGGEYDGCDPAGLFPDSLFKAGVGAFDDGFEVFVHSGLHARSMLWRAASAVDPKSPDATGLCAQGKQVATDAGFNAANDALQLFGGYGYLADYGVEKIVRDLRAHQILEGTKEIMRVIVAPGLVEN
jgi:hypothetical protein